MSMTLTQKILAAHAGLQEVKAGDLIEAKLDLVLGNDITAPVAIRAYAPPLLPSLLTSTLLPPCSFTFAVPWLSLIPPSSFQREAQSPSLAEVDIGHRGVLESSHCSVSNCCVT